MFWELQFFELTSIKATFKIWICIRKAFYCFPMEFFWKISPLFRILFKVKKPTWSPFVYQWKDKCHISNKLVFYTLYWFSKQTDSNWPSRLEIVFLLVSCTSLPVPKFPNTWCFFKCYFSVIKISLINRKLWLLQMNLNLRKTILL